jgi:hypothetical protein
MAGMKRDPFQAVPIVVVACLLLTAAYLGSFYALLEPRPMVVSAGTVYPRYTIGGKVSEIVFSPAYELYLVWDRYLAPQGEE